MAGDKLLLDGLGLQLKRARKVANLTQEEVAERAGISRPQYGKIEHGDAAARVTTLINVARALRLELMLIPQPVVPSVNSILRSGQDDRPAFVADSEDE